MAKIIFISDTHIGMNFVYNVDVRTGISQRSMDFIAAVERAVNYALENQVDAVIVCGDFYDSVLVGPTFRSIVRSRILEPLLKKEIRLIFVGGNHDAPVSLDKGSPLEDMLFLPNVLIARKPTHYVLHVGSEKLGFVLLPYLAPQQAVLLLQKDIGADITHQNWHATIQQYYKKLVQQFAKEYLADCATKILVGHYYFLGAKIRNLSSPEVLPGELEMTEEILSPDLFDLCVLGHVHLHQSFHNRRIVLPGAIERVDIAERDDPKGFILFDTQKHDWKFVNSSPRKMIKVDITIDESDLEPGQTIIGKIPIDVDNAIIRIDVVLTTWQKQLVAFNKLDKRLEKAFSTEVVFHTQTKETETNILRELTLDPLGLFEEFLEESAELRSHQDKDQIRQMGRQTIHEILTKGDQ